MTTSSPVQIPLSRVIAREDGRVGQDWAMWFNSLTANLPPAGSGYVLDGSNSSYGPMEIYQGAASARGSSPMPGSIYFALDTGDIYVEQGGSWELQTGMLTGDVLKDPHSSETTLKTVNPSWGTWGDSSNVPIFTVNAKGLITSVTTVPLTAAPPTLAGPPNALQFNLDGALGGTGLLTFNLALQKLYTQNLGVGGTITFANPLPTFNNLSPLTTRGDVLSHDGTDNIRLPVGIEGQVPTADPDVPAGLRYSDQRGEAIVTFHFGDATPKNIHLLKAGKVVFTVDLIITVPFDDVEATLSVGDADEPERLQEITDNLPTAPGTYTTGPSHKYAVQTQLLLTINPATATTGEGVVVITHSP